LRSATPDYGVADGDGEGDSSVVAAFFFLGAGDVSEAVVVFFLVDAAVVPVDFFVVEVDAAVVVDVASFFCAQETTRPAATRAMIQDRTDFFIDLVKRSRLFGCRANGKQLITLASSAGPVCALPPIAEPLFPF
jgi:hypothetical protein